MRYRERDHEARIGYLRTLRQIVSKCGSDNLVYVDESGFEASTYRPYGWGYIGQKVYGERSGNARPRTSLIAAKCGTKLLAPFLFDGATDARWFNQWLTQHLFKELQPGATVILDNATFHKTPETLRIFSESPYNLLFLPAYSPDLNPIEQVFATIKKRRQYETHNTTLDCLVKSYENYPE